ncbi:KAP family P-loop NTPase fold protein [Vibrio quintilis]|uniref:KAP family P-loop domain protein n=1 Tax=Vibrio quintilis TaxID=1117707 RepID=A0A1M7YP44_9VIBR|nr:P-loop NTPase fold protein [Vibrio quintilis]SHO54402.1 KAP family P-loop domain protein [Vibrio quintilis]
MSDIFEQNWSEETDIEGVMLPADAMERERYAEFFTEFLSGEGKPGNGYVLNIDAPWGTGKTYFLQRWKNSIEHRFPVVYIDAWKQDYSDDPMLTIFASIVGQLKKMTPETEKSKAVLSKLGKFSKAVAPALVKSLVKKATGVTVDELYENMSEDDGKQLTSTSSDVAGKLTEELIKDHNAKLASINDIREAIAAWVDEVIDQTERESPAFIFVDELDRCRPSYALEMLEVIKHFFSTEGVVFVIATDTEQLQHTIKGFYGAGFDAQVYLGRFFNRRATLNSVSRSVFIKAKLGQTECEKILYKVGFPQIDLTVDKFADVICSIADAADLSLREVEQLIDRTISVLRFSKKPINVMLFLILCICYQNDRRLYRQLIKGVQINTEVETVNRKLNDLMETSIRIKCVNGQIASLKDENTFSIRIKHLIILFFQRNKAHYNQFDKLIRIKDETNKHNVISDFVQYLPSVSNLVYQDLVELSASLKQI